MIKALQDNGSCADPFPLAGGIWQALLSTTASIAVAIPVSTALTWFESVIERVQGDMEDSTTRIFTHQQLAPDIALESK
ncbi:MAG: MotA/TolQ/ExbB proton channel family protein [Alphaproteobacteria bacterium]|nr:MotA/TolQ/ExbB proton channel family protein [Alphaproteobacteria bacterium]